MPIVAAMLTLLALGIPLVELSASQVSGSATSMSGVRAFWIAEAGIHHAASVGASVTADVTFADGKYVVEKAGDDYASVAKLNDSVKRVERNVVDQGSGGGPLADPIDVDASLSIAYVADNRRVDIPLVSVAPYDLILESFSLRASVTGERLRALYLDGDRIFRRGSGEPIPIDTLDLTNEPVDERTISPGQNPVLRLEFRSAPSGTIWYQLVLNFSDGASTVFDFGVAW